MSVRGQRIKIWYETLILYETLKPKWTPIFSWYLMVHHVGWWYFYYWLPNHIFGNLFFIFYNSVRLCCLLDFSLTKKLLGNQTVPSNFDLSSGWWYYFSHPKKSPVPYCAASVIYHQNWPSIFFSLATFNQLNFWLWSFGPQEFYVSCKRTPNIIAMKLWGFFIVYEE